MKVGDLVKFKFGSGSNLMPNTIIYHGIILEVCQKIPHTFFVLLSDGSAMYADKTELEVISACIDDCTSV